MEIERKYLIEKIPFDLKDYRYLLIEQAYLCTSPVVRIRRQNNDFYLTYKSKGLLAREEYNLPLDEKSYTHLIQKADGHILCKKRYLIPLEDGLTAELDIFEKDYEGLMLAEVEFQSIDDANAFIPPKWFGQDVTMSGEYQNSRLSQMKIQKI